MTKRQRTLLWLAPLMIFVILFAAILVLGDGLGRFNYGLL